MERMIAIDGNSLMHRAFYALPPMLTRDGTPTGAVHGFMSMLLKLIDDSPDYLLVAFDMHGPTFRHERYPDYKAGRRPTPEDLKAQFPLLRELLTAAGIRICECERYEADDILGTLSRYAEAKGIESLLVTGDRDALQLVTEHTHVLMTKKGITDTIRFTPELLLEKYGLTPDHMRDLKGLMGDSSDHIPGVPGVGEKTALTLLLQFGTLQSVLDHADEIKGKLGEKIRQYTDSARLSYQLGTIDTSAPVSVTLDDCRFHRETLGQAAELLQKLELRAILARIGSDSSKQSVGAEKLVAEEHVITNFQELSKALTSMRQSARIAFEMTGSITFANAPDQYDRIASGETLFDTTIGETDFLKAIGALAQSPNIQKTLYDAKLWKHRFERERISLQGEVFDTMLSDYLLHANRPSGGLGDICHEYFGNANVNAAALLRLTDVMRARLDDADMTKLYDNIEKPLSEVLFDMENAGFLIDAGILRHMQAEYGERLNVLRDQITEAAGHAFNILSPKQLAVVLFQELKLPTRKKTKSGYSTDAETLDQLAELHPIVPLVLEYRFLSKLKGTFLDGLLTLQSPSDGRVRTRFNQCVTATGRISSTEPNLQNIPTRTQRGREIRKAFIAPEGHLLIDADYSQIELRVLAHISGDEGMIAAFHRGADFHSSTAADVFGVDITDVTKEMRSAAKAVNFGIIYGISDFGLAKNLGIPVKEAAAYIRMYLSHYPRVEAYMKESVARAKECGYAQTLFGRRRPVPELSSGNYNTRSFGERVAMNMPIQGTAADIIKMAMVKAYREIQTNRLHARLILQVHDELIFEVPDDKADDIAALVQTWMETVTPLSVPLQADVKVGRSWYETK